MILYGVYAHILFFIFSWSVAGNSHSCHHCDNSPHSLHIDCMFPTKVHKLNSLSDTISNLAACFSTKPTACLTVTLTLLLGGRYIIFDAYSSRGIMGLFDGIRQVHWIRLPSQMFMCEMFL